MPRGEVTGRKPRVSGNQKKIGQPRGGPPIPNEINPTPPAEPIAKRKSDPPPRIRGPPLDELLAFSIEQFCQAHGISVAFYYKLRNKNPPETPREMQVGVRVLISRESAAEWRATREAAAA